MIAKSHPAEQLTSVRQGGSPRRDSAPRKGGKKGASRIRTDGRSPPDTKLSQGTQGLKFSVKPEALAAPVEEDRPAVVILPPAKPQRDPQAPAERDSFKLYMQEIGKVPLLTADQEVSLAKKIRRGDQEARNLMIRANLRLVVKIAMDYRDFGLPLGDLISEGNLGLIKAVERFDPNKGGKLSTYAAWWIKQSIKRALANQSKTIRLPVHLMEKLTRIRQAVARLTDELGREPTDEEIAYELQIPANKVAHLRSVSIRPASLDARIGDDDSSATFGDVIGDENATDPFDSLREKTARRDLEAMVDSLDEREARIIRLRFGLDGDRALTLEEVGKLFRLTRERVRQLQNLALSRMRNRLMESETQRTIEEIRTEEKARARQQVLRDFYEAKVRKDRN